MNIFLAAFGGAVLVLQIRLQAEGLSAELTMKYFESINQSGFKEATSFTVMLSSSSIRWVKDRIHQIGASKKILLNYLTSKKEQLLMVVLEQNQKVSYGMGLLRTNNKSLPTARKRAEITFNIVDCLQYIFLPKFEKTKNGS